MDLGSFRNFRAVTKGSGFLSRACQEVVDLGSFRNFVF
jgi:hypothetical protein